jgi:hypothetical protein
MPFTLRLLAGCLVLALTPFHPAAAAAAQQAPTLPDPKPPQDQKPTIPPDSKTLPQPGTNPSPTLEQTPAPEQKPKSKGEKPVPTKEGALATAKRVLGNYAEIVKYGELNRPGITEAVAVIKRGPESEREGLLVSDLAILQFRGAAWKVALSTDRYGAKNSTGYVGVDFLSDSMARRSFHLKFLDRALGRTRFTLMLSFEGKSGRAPSLPVVISWNPKVARYEALDERGSKFLPEVANPPELSSEKGK